MYQSQIAECCKVLKLSAAIAQTGIHTDAETHQEFLFKVLRDEIKRRQEAKKVRLINNAGFYSVKTFDDYSFDEVTLPTALSAESLQSADFIEKKQNLILYGNVGTGKTHLATAIGVNACNQGKEVRFFRTAALVNYLSEQKARGNLTKVFKTLEKASLIILDEWGYVPLDRDGARLLFQVVSDSYERRSLILTTNLQFSKWVTIFYDEQMTASIIDRLVHYGHLVIFDGKSKRLKGALMKG